MITRQLSTFEETNGRIRPQAVDKPCVHARVKAPQALRESMVSTIKVIRKARGVHSHHRIMCTRHPVTWSTRIGTSTRKVIQFADAAMLLTEKAAHITPEGEECDLFSFFALTSLPLLPNRFEGLTLNIKGVARCTSDAVSAQAVKPADIRSALSAG